MHSPQWSLLVPHFFGADLGRKKKKATEKEEEEKTYRPFCLKKRGFFEKLGKLLRGASISDILTRRCPPWWLGKDSGAKLFWVVSPTRSIASPRQVTMGTDHISRKTPAFSSYLLQTRLEATRFTRNSGNSHQQEREREKERPCSTNYFFPPHYLGTLVVNIIPYSYSLTWFFPLNLLPSSNPRLVQSKDDPDFTRVPPPLTPLRYWNPPPS